MPGSTHNVPADVWKEFTEKGTRELLINARPKKGKAILLKSTRPKEVNTEKKL